ncbi:MAG: hypothetical protein CFH10_02061 [Alphaproteobacteria bacterium MarineAlpha4_Bin2]|nr:MAG: hypothetical protein CFH10_02061 [Alphaproteobacteria bacterium MarineAlpha4_Bin2]
MQCSNLLHLILVVTFTVTTLVSNGFAQSLNLDSQSKKAVETIIRDYLISNPEVIEQAIQALQAKREAEDKDRAQAAIASKNAALVAHPMTPFSGNAAGDVTIVEFFDYQCGYCKSAMTALIGLLRSDNNVRVVWKELPILGNASRFAARAAMAAKKQNKYLDYHIAIMGLRGRLTEQNVMSTAKSVGINVKRLRRDMRDPKIETYLDETQQLATTLGIRGTPAFVIGDTLFPGALDEATIKKIIGKIRAGQ